MNKSIHIFGGGTMSYVRNHLALCIPAFGTTAKTLTALSMLRFKDMDINVHLTKMADCNSNLVTNEDVYREIYKIVEDFNTKIVFFNVALNDWHGQVGEIESGKYAKRLQTKDDTAIMTLTAEPKILKYIRQKRKDIHLVAFKTTCGATEQEQYLTGLDLLKKNSCNLVLANDTKTRLNMIITPEEARYHVTTDRDEALAALVDMAYYRSHLSFTRSTVVSGEPISWHSDLVFPSLRVVVDYCVRKNAYKPFNGATVGHFACKISPTEFLTSIRKSNFNDLEKNGLVRVEVDGEDSVLAYGAKPSVGGQSQRIVFNEHPDYDCIVHFHCPIKDGSEVPVVSQREYECGSMECGSNCSRGLYKFKEYELSAVMLDNHGPNIVFNHSIDPMKVIKFIEENFDLSDKTGGLVN